MACSLHNDEQTRALFRQAKEDYENSRYREAIDVYEHLLEYHTDVIAGWYIKECLGILYYHTEEYEKAETYLRSAMETISRHKGDELHKLVISDNLACTYERKGDAPMAMEYSVKAKKLLHLYKGRGWAVARYSHHLIKGRCHYELGQFKEALEEFQEAHKEILDQQAYSDVSESENIIIIEMARTQDRLGNHDKAQELYESVDTSELETYWRSQLKYGLFTLYATQKKYEAALKEFEDLESLQMEGVDKAGVYYVLGLLYFGQGEHDKAHKNFEKSLSTPTAYEWIHKGCRGYLKDIESAS